MRNPLRSTVLAAAALALTAGVASADLYMEVESARANARAGGPTNARDRDLLDKYGALSGTPGYSKSGLRRLNDDRQYRRKYRRDE